MSEFFESVLLVIGAVALVAALAVIGGTLWAASRLASWTDNVRLADEEEGGDDGAGL